MRQLPHADAGRRPLPAGRHGAQLRHVPQPQPSTGSAARCARCATASRAQVVADIRGLYRAGGPAFPPELSPGGRAAARATSTRSAPPSSSPAPRPSTAQRGERAIQAIFTGDRHLLRMPRRASRRPPARSTTGSRPVQFPAATSSTAGSTTAPHQIVQRPGERRLDGSPGCLSCHNANALEQLQRPAAAEPGELPRLPWRRADQPAGALHLRDVPRLSHSGGAGRRAPPAGRCRRRGCATVSAAGHGSRPWRIRHRTPEGQGAGRPDHRPSSGLRSGQSGRVSTASGSTGRCAALCVADAAAGPAARHRRHRRQWRRPRCPTSGSGRRSPICLSRSVRAMGNHDSRAVFSRDLPGYAGRRTASSNMRSRIWPVRILVLDTLEEGRHGGGFCEIARRLAGGAAAEAPERPTLIVLHHPPIDTGLSWMTENPEAHWVARLRPIVAGQSEDRRAWSAATSTARSSPAGPAPRSLVCPSTAPQVALDLSPIDPGQSRRAPDDRRRPPLFRAPLLERPTA